MLIGFAYACTLSRNMKGSGHWCNGHPNRPNVARSFASSLTPYRSNCSAVHRGNLSRKRRAGTALRDVR
jgi:hypothetical protein